MDSNTSEGVKRALRNRILDFQPLDENGAPVGAPLRAAFGGGTNARFYLDRAPDNAAFPNAIARLMNQGRPGTYNGERIRADLEIMLFARDKSQAADLEAIADVIDQSMLRMRDNSSGLMFSRGGERDTLPPAAEPEARGVVQIRLVYPLAIWPRYLTRYASQ